MKWIFGFFTTTPCSGAIVEPEQDLTAIVDRAKRIEGHTLEESVLEFS